MYIPLLLLLLLYITHAKHDSFHFITFFDNVVKLDDYIKEGHKIAVLYHNPEDKHSRITLRHFSKSNKLINHGIHPVVFTTHEETPKITYYNRGIEKHSLWRKSILINETSTHKWITGTAVSRRSLIQTYTHDFIEYNHDFYSTTDKSLHILVFLSPYPTFTNAEVVSTLHTYIHSYADKLFKKQEDPLNDVALVYIPYKVSEYRDFLTSFNMVDATNLHCKETKHVFVVIKDDVLQERKHFVKKSTLQRYLKETLHNL